MAAIASAASGNFSAGATWVGGIAPAPGDTVVVNAAHAVTFDVDAVIGSAPATGGTAALAANGAVTVAAGKVLEVAGDVIVGNVPLTFQAGSSLLSNPASGVIYLLTVGTVAGQTATRLVCNGTSGAHVTIRKKAGALGTFQGTTVPVSRGGKMTATFTDFIGLGTASSRAWTWSPTGSEVFITDDCTMNACGEWALSTGVSSTTSNRFRRSRWLSSVGTINMTLTGSTVATAGERILDRCSFDKIVVANVVGFLATENRFSQLSGGSTGPDWAAGSRDNIIISTGQVTLGNSALNSRWYVVLDSASNPHFIGASITRSQVFDQIIMECPNAAGPTDGDGLIVPNPTSPRTYTFTRCYMLPNVNGRSPGKLVAALGNANDSIIVEHCTAVLGGSTEQGVGVGETYNGYVGMLASMKSNLMYRTAGGAGYFLTRLGGSQQDIAVASTVDYNAGWGMSPGTDGNGVNALSGVGNFFSVSGMHQTHGITLAADPFVDKARNLAKWGLSKGGTGTYADARDNLFALTAGWNVADLIDYVIAGFQVTDIALKDAGHDGVTIGASDFSGSKSAALTGTAAAAIVEANVVAGGKQIVLTLTNETFIPI